MGQTEAGQAPVQGAFLTQQIRGEHLIGAHIAIETITPISFPFPSYQASFMTLAL